MTEITHADRADHEIALRREATIIGVDPGLPARELVDAIINWHLKLEREDITPVDIDVGDLTSEDKPDNSAIELTKLRAENKRLRNIVAGGAEPDTPDVVRDAHAWLMCAEMRKLELENIHAELDRVGIPCWNGNSHDSYVMRIRRLAERNDRIRAEMAEVLKREGVTT